MIRAKLRIAVADSVLESIEGGVRVSFVKIAQPGVGLGTGIANCPVDFLDLRDSGATTELLNIAEKVLEAGMVR